jgi:pilus assembly protein CpaE
MVKANEKLAVLSAEAPINQPLMTDGAAFFQLQEELRTAFECTVIDLPRGMLVQHPHLMSDVQATIVTTELTLASARDVIRILSWLKSNAPQSSIMVIANKVAGAGPGEISRKDFEASIERKIDYVVPLDVKVATQAAKLGKTLAEAGKGTKAATALIEIANRLVTTVEEAAAAAATEGKPSRKGSLLGKLSGITSMLPKKSREKVA